MSSVPCLSQSASPTCAVVSLVLHLTQFSRRNRGPCGGEKKPYVPPLRERRRRILATELSSVKRHEPGVFLLAKVPRLDAVKELAGGALPFSDRGCVTRIAGEISVGEGNAPEGRAAQNLAWRRLPV